MTAAAILARARDAGVHLEVRDGGLRLRAAVPPPADLLDSLRAHKSELLELLGEPATDPAGDTDLLDAPLPEPPPLPAPGSPERTVVDAKQAEMVGGLLQAAARRPPSWWAAEPHQPVPGATCSCCRGRRWWTRDRRGWRCTTCHPAPSASFIEVVT